MDWLDLLAVQGTLKSLLQHHSSKASILQCSTFFMVQSSHPYMTTGKTRALTRQTFVGKAMSLLFNILSWLVIAFLPRSKHLLISWLQSPSAVILEPKKIKSDTVSTVSQHQGLFKWVHSSHQVVKVLEFHEHLSWAPNRVSHWGETKDGLDVVPTIERASQVALVVKNPPANAGDLGSIPGLERSPGEGNGYPLQYSGLENSVDCIVHGIAQSWTRLNDWIELNWSLEEKLW